MDLSKLTDDELIALYNATDPDSAEVERISGEMEERGVDL